MALKKVEYLISRALVEARCGAVPALGVNVRRVREAGRLQQDAWHELPRGHADAMVAEVLQERGDRGGRVFPALRLAGQGVVGPLAVYDRGDTLLDQVAEVGP